MARVVVIAKILPEDVETPPEAIVERIKAALPSDTYEVLKSRTEPVAFGINAIYIWIAMPETLEGGTFDLESRLSSVEGVGQVDIVSVSRMLE